MVIVYTLIGIALGFWPAARARTIIAERRHLNRVDKLNRELGK